MVDANQSDRPVEMPVELPVELPDRERLEIWAESEGPYHPRSVVAAVQSSSSQLPSIGFVLQKQARTPVPSLHHRAK